MRLYRVRVEDDDVGLEAVPQDSPVRQAEALRRERRHLPYRLREPEVLLGADVLCEDDGEAAVAPGVRVLTDQDGVAGDDSVRVGDEGVEGVRVGAQGDD